VAADQPKRASACHLRLLDLDRLYQRFSPLLVVAFAVVPALHIVTSPNCCAGARGGGTTDAQRKTGDQPARRQAWVDSTPPQGAG
jgi:hypothetical protein